ncbi:DUF2235 domain-containing protein [Phormidium sp. LEGE 05292]|uniref:DUF2235 domain-containing protein n=1 Tax=[Phormidium] sp. LEGE 05292 TaxID=767427 RepID=UPI001881A234|nr:DUF2235 domain-containing protein [Phormidium sp. LEGE 05292]MBE9229120.1 DUF2235 domain-containing protein [Phormidium sp. LEGE 05292]
MKKRLVVCCDGTWNQLRSSYPTNVVKLAQSVKYITDDGTPQIVFYQQGLGTEDSSLWQTLGGGAFGWGIDKLIQDAYRFLCVNYNTEAEDEIYLFGFSRGAYIVRCLAGMIYCSGLLHREQIRKTPQAYKIYRDRKIHPDAQEAKDFRKKNAKSVKSKDTSGQQSYMEDRVSIKMLGCWDTVGALGMPDIIPWLPIEKIINQKYLFYDPELSPIVENAFQAVAIDEKRKSFPSTRMDKNSKNPNQRVEEVWFSGEHGCVGGGTKGYQGLSDCALAWMIERAKEVELECDQRKIERDFDSEGKPTRFGIYPEPTIYFDNSLTFPFILGGEESRSIRGSNIKFHSSVKERLKKRSDYLPENLKQFIDRLKQ